MLALFLCGCDGNNPIAPTTVTAGGWDVTFESTVPEDVPDNSLYFEMVNHDVISQGFVDIAVQVRAIKPRLVGTEGSLTYRTLVDGAAQPISFRTFFEGGFFERAGRRVLYEVDNLSLFQQVLYELTVDGPSAGVNGSGTLLTVRFDLRRSGDAEIGEALLAFATTADGDTFGFESLNERVYSGTLHVRERQ